MDYPKDILPRKGFIVPFPFQKLSDTVGDYVLCYRIDGSVEENLELGTFNGQQKLKKTCFMHLPHMSMNLCGGLFQPCHVRFVQKKPACDKWDNTCDVSLDEYIQYVTENERYTPVFYRASELCQKDIRIPVLFPDKSAYKAAAGLYAKNGFILPPYEKGKPVETVTEIRVEHVPTNLNYWHTQMEVYPPHGETELKDDNATWRKRIFNQIRDSILCYYYAKEMPIDYQISEELYRCS